MKSFFAYFLVFILLIFSSCSNDIEETGEQTGQNIGNTTETEDNTLEAKQTVIADESGTDYIIVLPSGCFNTLSDAANDIKERIFDITGRHLWVKYDEKQEEQEFEILVGSTNRKESSACDLLLPNQYEIKFSGTKLLVLGGSQNAASAGLKKLFDNYLSADGAKTFVIPSDLYLQGETEMVTIENLSSGWNSCIYPASNGIELLYQLRLPENYDTNKDYPVILYMHSAGVRCDDNSHIYTGEAKFLRNLENSAYAEECIVVAPCCPQDSKWVDVPAWNVITYSTDEIPASPHMTAAMELFAEVRENLSCDENQLYTYGMSMGGFAVWDILSRYPGVFAAAIPVAGCGDPAKAASFEDTAIWVFHGDRDGAVPYESALRMINALREAGRNDIKFTTFEGAAHGIWSLTADTEGILGWLFAQRR